MKAVSSRAVTDRWIYPALFIVLLLPACDSADHPLEPTLMHENIDPETTIAEPALRGNSAVSSWGNTPAEGDLGLFNTDPVNASTSTAASSNVAIITIFADGVTQGTGSSGGGSSTFGTHAFITVRNMADTAITVGRLSGIRPGKTVSVGTWGNKSEHKGLWYNLEGYFVSKYGAYSSRVSAAYLISSAQMSTLTTFIRSNDSWSVSSNCSSFAVGAWNKVVDSYARLSAGVPNTPKNLASSIKSKFSSYSTRAKVPYDYAVYYAVGSGAPQKSKTYK